MSGQYYELDEQDPEEHIHASADRHTPTYYHQPTHQRTSSYHGSVAGQFPEPEDKPYEYAPQDYQMPLWPEDDHYRMGTPVNVYPGADGSNIYTGVRPPPPPPNPYLQDFPEDPNNPRVSYHQRDSTYSNYGLDENPFHEPSDSEVRPILRPQESQATLGTEKGSKWADVKDVTLKSGNLVLNCPLPDALMNKLPRKAPLEFSCMRYSAVTCDPKDFVEKRFALRQTLFGQPRQTELFIVVTMYNEEENLFARTMAGVFKNIEYMCTKAKDKMWGENAWKKIVVCVVSDGRNKINPKTRSLLALMGCYQEGIAKTKINGEAVQAHIFEHTTQVGIKMKGDKVEAVPGMLTHPVQMLFCLKEQNQQKINSHRWFFQAFGPAIEPNICVLIDAGTMPGSMSIYHLWKSFILNPQCGGSCGEIKAMLSEGGGLLNPLVATQNFEYKMSNILDKPLESVFGFISVLPGAFSAYRYSALQNGPDGNGPLQMYFKGEEMHAGTVEAGILTKNMYLAEDRILCFELVTKRNSSWTLQYVKSAHAATDVPSGLTELVKQRRRWLNGSFFAAIFALVNTKHIWRSNHSWLRKLVFLVEFFYQTINLIFSWFAIANFFLVFRILTASLGEKAMGFPPGNILGVIFEWIYFGTLFTCFILALGNKPEGSRKMYFYMTIIWAVIMVYLMFAAIFVTVKSVQKEVATAGGITVEKIATNRIFLDLVISLSSTYVLYIVASFMYLEPWHMFHSFFQYLILSPSYINVLNVYAFCNVHDISWGTKGAGATQAHDPNEVVEGDKTKLGASLKQDSKDREENYQEELRRLSGAIDAEKVVKPKTEAELRADQDQAHTYYYADVRCFVVLAWCASNFALAATILNSGGLNRLVSENEQEVQDTRSTIYLSIILWSVAVLAAVRFFGATWFLILRAFRGV